MIVFFAEKLDGDLAYFDAEEAKHCIKVLRKRTDGLVHFTDGKGGLYTGKIMSSSRNGIILNQIETIKNIVQTRRVYLLVAPTKNLNRFEWFVEKVVEIGVTDIVPIVCSRSERKELKSDRIERIIKSAAKQSLKFKFPTLHEPISFTDSIKQYAGLSVDKYIASFDDKNAHLNEYKGNQKDQMIYIGPEGDFTAEELELAVANGFEKVNISDARLRTETAGLVAAHLLCLKNEMEIINKK